MAKCAGLMGVERDNLANMLQELAGLWVFCSG